MSIGPFRISLPTLLPLVPILMLLLTLASGVAAQPAASKGMRERLIREIEVTTRNFDGVMGVAIRDLKSDDEILIDGEATYPTGSSIKIPILIELHRQVAAGSLKLTDTLPVEGRNQVGGSGVMVNFSPGSSQLSLHDLSVLMIALSDNSATNMLIDRLGMARINQTMNELGLGGIRLQRKMIDLAAMARGAENLATPREASRLMELLAKGKVVSPEVSGAVLKTLRIPKVSPIPRRLPANVTIANKPGGLEGVACDWALVEVPNRPFTIAVMSTWNGEAAGADEVIAKIARLAYDYFARLARSTPYGARIPLGLTQSPK
jgi:beta-lactamase class A